MERIGWRLGKDIRIFEKWFLGVEKYNINGLYKR